MSRQHLVIVISIILLIVASLAYLVASKSPSPSPTTESEPETITVDDTALGSDEVRYSDGSRPLGTYTAYSADKIASTEGVKLLFFHAPWCPQCRALEKSIEQGDIPEGVTIFKVDYDSNHQLRQKYGITIQTTLLKIDDNGDKIDSFVAYDEPTLAAVKRELLQ